MPPLLLLLLLQVACLLLAARVRAWLCCLTLPVQHAAVWLSQQATTAGGRNKPDLTLQK
jgi:hypothetical protein